MRTDKINYYLDIAETVLERGTCLRRNYGAISLIYRIVGDATNILADVCSGDRLSVVGPLGHGFDRGAKHALLVGGGTGLAPLLYLAESLAEEGIRPDPSGGILLSW